MGNGHILTTTTVNSNLTESASFDKFNKIFSNPTIGNAEQVNPFLINTQVCQLNGSTQIPIQNGVNNFNSPQQHSNVAFGNAVHGALAVHGSTNVHSSSTSNYDAFRGIPIETLSTGSPTISASVAIHSKEITNEKPHVSMDLFKDAAASAFMEFGKSSAFASLSSSSNISNKHAISNKVGGDFRKAESLSGNFDSSFGITAKVIYY